MDLFYFVHRYVVILIAGLAAQFEETSAFKAKVAAQIFAKREGAETGDPGPVGHPGQPGSPGLTTPSRKFEHVPMCRSCGGVGQHRTDCEWAAKRQRMEPAEVSMLDVLMENRELRAEVKALQRPSSGAAPGTAVTSALLGALTVLLSKWDEARVAKRAELELLYQAAKLLPRKKIDAQIQFRQHELSRLGMCMIELKQECHNARIGLERVRAESPNAG